MKEYTFRASLVALAVLIGACETPGELKVKNAIRGAVIKDVRWGDVFLEDRLLPGETSRTAVIYDRPDYGVDLPATLPVKFYMEVNGDLLYLQTREEFPLDEDESVEIVLDDSTPVFNPVLE